MKIEIISSARRVSSLIVILGGIWCVLLGLVMWVTRSATAAATTPAQSSITQQAEGDDAAEFTQTGDSGAFTLSDAFVFIAVGVIAIIFVGAAVGIFLARRE